MKYLNLSVFLGQEDEETWWGIETFIYAVRFYYFRMIKEPTLTDLLRSIDEIRRSVNDANMKLDHLIETYRHDRNTRAYDLFDYSHKM